MSEHFDCEPDFLPPEQGGLAGVTKYRSKTSGMTVYFADVDSQVINGYFCFGTDKPEAGGIEQLIHHLDSSGGLLPRPMRGDMLRPAWQFHGAENPLADRDQSCFVCCALGEPAFLGTFSCSAYLLQNIEAVLELHGYPYKPLNEAGAKKDEAEDAAKTPDAKGDNPEQGMEGLNLNDNDEAGENSSDEEGESQAPRLEDAEYYCLSEAGEGAMAWEGTLQAMFPGSAAFWNRLLHDGKSNRLSSKMRKCYDEFYRPDNMTVIITGSVQNRDHILDVLHDHEADFFETRPNLPPFEKPWSKPIARSEKSVESTAWFVCRNPTREASATVCIGWRGCPSTDLETAMAIKVLTAHIAVGPMWTKIVTPGNAHRISWCQLEYIDTCSLITVHGIRGEEMANKTIEIAKQTVDDLISDSVNNNLKLEDIRAMADRVGWHYIRELESEPFLMIASSIAKCERYGNGAQDQIKKRIRPRIVFDELVKKPREYWMEILQKYFKDNPVFTTKVLPRKNDDGEGKLVGSSEQSIKEEPSGDMNFAATSRRAASRPRRRSTNPVGEEANVAVDDDRRNDLVLPNDASAEEKEQGLGLLEEHLQINPFPFGDYEEERKEFESRLEVTKDFLDNVTKTELKSWALTSYNPDSETQHPLFPLKELPMYTFLEDTETSFVYLTAVLDTTHLDSNMRKLLPCVTAALGAFVCPRPPGLDTDSEIEHPNEFNPPMDIADSQVSIGLNGEMMQSIFLTIIVRPEKYAWAVGLLHHMMNDAEFSPNFLKFVAAEAARGLAANYKMQTAEKPNYDCFDSAEINLHSIIKQVYKEESNARLFVGRRRLDLMMENLEGLEKDPQEIANKTNAVWKSLTGTNKVIMQIAGNVQELSKLQGGDLVTPWKTYFKGIQKPMVFSAAQPTLEPAVMLQPKGTGIAVSVNQPRLPSLSIAVPIHPHSKDFPKLCMAAQLFSMAQKWIWSCWDLDDLCSPVIRMPCTYANLMTLNLESYDVIGCLKTMKMLMKEDWSWISAILTATKLMVVNDPASMELGAQGTIASALLSHLAGQPIEIRRDLLKDSMEVTVEDIKHVVNTYLVKFFDPAESCCSLMATDPAENARLTHRLEEIGYKMETVDLHELCKNL